MNLSMLEQPRAYLIEEMKHSAFQYTNSPFFSLFVNNKLQLLNSQPPSLLNSPKDTESDTSKSTPQTPTARSYKDGRRNFVKSRKLSAFRPELHPLWVETELSTWVHVIFKFYSEFQLIGHPSQTALTSQFIIDLSKITSKDIMYSETSSNEYKYIWMIPSHNLKLATNTLKDIQTWMNFLKRMKKKKKSLETKIQLNPV